MNRTFGLASSARAGAGSAAHARHNDAAPTTIPSRLALRGFAFIGSSPKGCRIERGFRSSSSSDSDSEGEPDPSKSAARRDEGGTTPTRNTTNPAKFRRKHVSRPDPRRRLNSREGRNLEPASGLFPMGPGGRPTDRPGMTRMRESLDPREKG